MSRFLDWIDDRTGIRRVVRGMLWEWIPGGPRWRYIWGSILVIVFAVQVITGIFLMTAYSPSAATAWESVYYIQYEMEYGWLLRGIHHFSAQAMVVLLAAHMLQVVLAGAYRAPREFNWWTGLFLLLITLGLSLTGYLLPWDQKGYWATKVATNITALAPGLGDEVQQLVVGGPEYGHHTLTRFFALHVAILPALLVLILVPHLALFRRHGVTSPVADGRREPIGEKAAWALSRLIVAAAAFYALSLLVPEEATRIRVGLWIAGGVVGLAWAIFAFRRRRDGYFWPGQLLRDCLAALIVVAVVAYFVARDGFAAHATAEQPLGAHLGAPADPAYEYSAARPEWYFLFLFQFLKYFPGSQTILGISAEVVGAIFIPTLVVVYLFLMPLVGRTTVGHIINIVVMVALLLGIGLLTYRAIEEDRANPRYAQAVEEADAHAHRAVVLAEQGIPPRGAIELMRSDPLIMGPRLFAQHCAACHRWNGHDGRGYPVMRTNAEGLEVPAEPTASDLGPVDPQAGRPDHLSSVGSGPWAEAFLRNPAHERFFGNTALADGEMAQWSQENIRRITEEELAAVVAMLVAEADRPHAPPPSPALLERGNEILDDFGGFEDFEVPRCTECHAWGERISVGTVPAPDLTGWGSAEWLRAFIANSHDERFYGERSAMPPFADPNAEEQSHVLSDDELDLLVRWMIGDYYDPRLEAGVASDVSPDTGDVEIPGGVDIPDEFQ